MFPTVDRVDDATLRFRAELGQLLAGLRERAGLSQEALGQQLGLGQSGVSKVESGRRGLHVEELVAWVAALGRRLPSVAEEVHGIYESLVPGSIWEREP